MALTRLTPPAPSSGRTCSDPADDAGLSFIWGINTIFLLNAGLSNAEAFAANAFFTVGEVIFEVPTGVVADKRGRKLSYVLGAATLLVSTLLYLLMWHLRAPLYGDKTAYAVAGLAAAILAAVQIAGGLRVPQVRRFFRRRTTALVVGGVINVGLLALLGMTGNFYVALLLLAGWAFVFAVESPVRQARRERAVSDPHRSRRSERRRRRAGAAAGPSAADADQADVTRT